MVPSCGCPLVKSTPHRTCRPPLLSFGMQGFDPGAVPEPTEPAYRTAAATAVNIHPLAKTFEGLVPVSLDAPPPTMKRKGKQVRRARLWFLSRPCAGAALHPPVHLPHLTCAVPTGGPVASTSKCIVVEVPIGSSLVDLPYAGCTCTLLGVISCRVLSCRVPESRRVLDGVHSGEQESLVESAGAADNGGGSGV